jgi:flagellar biosynthetic protein FliR
MDLPVASAWAFGLLLLRTAGLFAVAPVISARSVPGRIRMALAVAVAFVVYTGAGSPAVPLPASIGGLAAAAGAETLAGLLAGLAARWVLEAAVGAGQIAGLSAGMGFSALVDPVNGVEANPIASVLSVVAQGSAVALGVHREAITWLVRSAVSFPPGAAPDLRTLAGHTLAQAVVAIALAVRLAFPVLAAVLLAHVAMGLVMRVAPQLSLATIGFSVAILAGGLALYVSAPAVAELAARAAIEAFQG